MKRYAIYTRVSSEEQASPGHVSLESQLQNCRRYVLERGGTVVMEQQDVQSGLDPARSGYQQVLAAAKGGDFDAAVVWRFDRWGRDAGEALTTFASLQRLGVAVESVMEPTSDPFLQGLFALLGYRESQSISQRTSAGLRTRAARGEWSGPPPLGYQLSRQDNRTILAPDPSTAPHVRTLFEEAATGRYSLAQLADRAIARGLRSRRGFIPSRQSVGRMLRNPAYRGAVVFGRRSYSRFGRVGWQPSHEWVVAEGAHTPLANSGIFEAVQAWLTRHRREQGMIRRSRFLLTSLVFCARCSGQPGPDGKPRLWRAYGHGTKGAVYQCSRSSMYGACDLPTISAPGLEEAVKAQIARTFSISSEVRARAAAYVAEEAEAARSAVERQRMDLEKALERHQAQRLALARRLLGKAGEAIPGDIYRRLEAEETLAVQRIEKELASLPPSPSATDVQPILAALPNLDWSDLSWEGWRQVLSLLVARVLLYGRGKFLIDWQPAADILRTAVDRVSHFGSLRLG